MKRLLVLGGAEFNVPLVKKAKEKAYYVGVVDINKDSPAFKYADKKYIVSLKDKEEVLRCAKNFNPDGITVGMVETAVGSCAYVTSKLNLPGIDEETARNSTDKYKMIKAFEKYNVPHPCFVYVPKNKILNKRIDITFPVIVKPVDMSGSRGIFLANNEVELKDAMQKSSKISYRGDVIVEEYMDGPEVSVELVIKDGIPHVIQITDKTTSGFPHFAEIGHFQPSQLPDDILIKIKEVACNAAKALNLKNSLGHAEIKVTSSGPKMVEMGARAGGDGIGEQLIELSTGVSFTEIAIQIAMGEEIIIPDKRLNKSSCIRFILSCDGVLKSVEGIDSARTLNNIKEVNIYGVPGNEYHDMIDNSGRIGYVISSSDIVKETKDSCDNAIDLIKVTYE